MEKARVRTDHLRVGMVVASDVFSVLGVKILPKGSILNEEAIQSIVKNMVTAVMVEAEEHEPKIIVTKTEEVMKSEDFKKFKKNFTITKEEIKNSLNEIVSSDKEIDVDAMLANMDKLISKVHTGTEIFEMLNCMKEDSDETFTHSLNVSLISNLLGRWARLPQYELDTIVVAALLHDIGKLKLPKEVLNKTSRLTPAERNIMRKHAVYGYNVLKNKVDEDIATVALAHHERYDGSGYPMQKKGLLIDKYSRLIAIADVFDDLTNKRAYRAAVCPFDVIKMLEVDGLHKFDVEFLFPFLGGIADTYINYQVELNTGQIATIVFSNKSRPSRPMVKMGMRYIDLAKEAGLNIVRIL